MKLLKPPPKTKNQEIRGAGRKTDLTRFEQNVDWFTAIASDIPNNLFICEALLKAKQNKVDVEHRFDAENDFSFDDWKELRDELDQSFHFPVSPKTTISSLSERIGNHKEAVEKTCNKISTLLKPQSPCS